MTLGKTIHTVVLDDVEHGNVAANDMLEMAQTNARRVTIAGNTQDFNFRVCKTCASNQCGHATMQAVETERAVQKIVRAFTGTTNTTDFNHLLWRQSKLKNSCLDDVGNSVMATSRAKCRFFTRIVTRG